MDGGRWWNINGNAINTKENNFRSLYSVETFNGNKYKKIILRLYIIQKKNNILFGIVNGFSDPRGSFAGKRNKCIHYSINGCNGYKRSHITKYKDELWASTKYKASFESGDIISLLIDFESLSISYFKNGNNMLDFNGNPMFNNIIADDFKY